MKAGQGARLPTFVPPPGAVQHLPGMHHEVACADASDTAATAPLDEQVVRVRRYLRFLGAERHAVDDLAQETMLAAVRTFAAAAVPLPWLLVTARNALRQHLRRIGRSREVADLERLDAAWRQQMGDDGGEARRAALAECLRALSDRARLVLDLRYRDGLSREAIANRAGLGDEGVKTLLARAREALGACIRRRLGDA